MYFLHSNPKLWHYGSMAIDPANIEPKCYDLLRQRARQTGRTEAELLSEALKQYFGLVGNHTEIWMKAQEPAFTKIWDNEEDSVF